MFLKDAQGTVWANVSEVGLVKFQGLSDNELRFLKGNRRFALSLAPEEFRCLMAEMDVISKMG